MTTPYRSAGVPTQPAPPEAAEAERRGENPAQDIEYEYPPTKVVVVSMPKREPAKEEFPFQVGVTPIVPGTIIPALLTGRKVNRTRMLIDNLGPDDIYYSHERGVTSFSGWRVQATDVPVELYTTAPIYVTTLDGTKTATVQVHEEFRVPYQQG